MQQKYVMPYFDSKMLIHEIIPAIHDELTDK